MFERLRFSSSLVIGSVLAILHPSMDSDMCLLALYMLYKKRKKKIRKYWVHPYIVNNINCRSFVAAKQLNLDPVKFEQFYRMTQESFLFLLEKVRPSIEKKDTNLMMSITAEERLLITLT